MESESGMRTDTSEDRRKWMDNFEDWWKEESINFHVRKEDAMKIWNASWKVNVEKILMPRMR